jgi:hypothetical protein
MAARRDEAETGVMNLERSVMNLERVANAEPSVMGRVQRDEPRAQHGATARR